MASFSVSVTATGSTTAVLNGTFYGDSYHDRARAIYVTGILGYGYYLTSNEDSGANNTFTDSFDGLTPGKTYDWEAVLCYWDTNLNQWVETSYSDSGSFTTEGGGTTGGAVYIYTDMWRAYAPYIYTDTWRPYNAEIYTDSWWESG